VKKKPDVFISHSREDKDFAGHLRRELERQGLGVFTDESIPAGANFQKEIQRQLASAKSVVALWSEDSLASPSVQKEAEEAKRQGKLINFAVDASYAPSKSMSATERSVIFTVGNKGSGKSAFLMKHLAELGVTVPAPTNKAAGAPHAEVSKPRNKGFVFVSHVAEDVPALEEVSQFLKGRGYSYWSYHDSERDYQKPTVIEIEERMQEAVVVLTVLSPGWKRSEWTQRELAFARELRKPLFHLRFRNPGPTLAIAGDTFFDIETNKDDGFRRLGIELDKKGL
jgi:TIR domain